MRATKIEAGWDEQIVAELGAYKQMLSGGFELPKPTRKFIGEMVEGLMESRSVLLSRIAATVEGPESLLYREQRLSYQLCSKRWDTLPVINRYLEWAREKIEKDTVISVDMGDIAKPYARRMPKLSVIWDGSKKKTEKGYALLEMEAIQQDGQHIPLYLETLSTRQARYVSQNHQIDWAIDFVRTHIGQEGIWVMDRGADDEKRFKFFDGRELDWVIRVRGDRHVEKAGHPELKAQSVSCWAGKVQELLQFSVKTLRGRIGYKVGAMRIALPDDPEKHYSLVVVWQGSKKRAWYLMSSLPSMTLNQLKKITLAYVRRWGVEDAARVIKQVFDLENIRLLTFEGIRRMVWLTLWAYGFLCVIGHWPGKALNEILSRVKSLWDWRDLKIVYYRVAESMAQILSASPPSHRRSVSP